MTGSVPKQGLQRKANQKLIGDLGPRRLCLKKS